MNQILATSTENNKKKSVGNAIDIKKIIVFFACAIFLFAVVLIGKAGYNIYTERKEANKSIVPTLVVEKVDNQIRITAKYETGIEKIRYYWDEGDIVEDKIEGRESTEKLISIPNGASKIIVILVGVDGKTIQEQVVFGSLIEIALIDDEYKIRITASNELGLQYMKYVWKGEEVKVEANEEDPTTIEVELDINLLEMGRGEYELIVTAVDTLDVETIVTRKLEGKSIPEIEFMQYDNIVQCTVTHEKGFEKIEIEFNNRMFVYDASSDIYDPNLTEFSVPIPLEPGENIIVIRAYSLEGTLNEEAGRTRYNP